MSPTALPPTPIASRCARCRQDRWRAAKAGTPDKSGVRLDRSCAQRAWKSVVGTKKRHAIEQRN